MAEGKKRSRSSKERRSEAHTRADREAYRIDSGKTIDVEFLRSPPVHDTFAKAVSASESRDAVARRDNETLSGDTIVAYSFSGRAVS